MPPASNLPQIALSQLGAPGSRERRFAHQALAAATQAASDNATSQPARAVGSLYIHVPFCFHKCHYCDFYSIVDSRDQQEAFVARLERELAALARWQGGGGLGTIFVGGGTPSLLRVELWERLLRMMRGVFDLSQFGTGPGEWTVECNPETVTSELMCVLREGGINRVSMGAQSFHPSHLRTLERWHDPASVARAIGLAQDAGIARQSIDLIYAIPGQTLEEWDADLRTALDLQTEHLSCYCLTYEPNTPMGVRLRQGRIEKASEDLEADMFEHTVRMLRGAGLERYEVSNFARSGAECRHNLAYWRQEGWLAAGPSASGHVRGVRWKNVVRLDDYLTLDEQGFAALDDLEVPDARRALRERLWTGLRLREGIDADAALRDAARLSPRLPDALERVVLRQASLGAVEDVRGPSRRWRATDRGFLIADAIAREFFAAVDGA